MDMYICKQHARKFAHSTDVAALVLHDKVCISADDIEAGMRLAMHSLSYDRRLCSSRLLTIED